MARRMKSVKESVKREKARHALLQKRYKELLRKTQELWFVCSSNRIESNRIKNRKGTSQ